MISGKQIKHLIENGDQNDPLRVVPVPDTKDLEEAHVASIDLRVGRWFLRPRNTRETAMDVIAEYEVDQNGEDSSTKDPEPKMFKRQYVNFGDSYVLHPRSFVLAATLEWVRLPKTIGGYITGRSSWGRRGLIIETAAGVHPCFTGCLTLEITNVGHLPIKIYPGVKICQLFLHSVEQPSEAESINTSLSRHVGRRRPIMSRLHLDSIAKRILKIPLDV